MFRKFLAATALGSGLLLSACAQQEVGVIYAEPSFDKYGNPSCRPGDVPVGGIYTADLPICAVISAQGVNPAEIDSDGDGVPDIDDPEPDNPDVPGDGTGKEKQNRYTKEEQTRTETENSGG